VTNEDPLFAALRELASASPSELRAARTRQRCRRALSRSRRQPGVLLPVAALSFCLAYLAVVAGQVVAVFRR
jgi:hypothetical protein